MRHITVDTHLALSQVDAHLHSLVCGQFLPPVRDNLYLAQVNPLLKQFSLNAMDTATWFPRIQLIKLHYAIESLQKGADKAVEIGIASFNHLSLDDSVQSVSQALDYLNCHYHAHHQGISENEGWEITRSTPERYFVTFHSPYSDFVAYGFLYALVRHYRRQQLPFSVMPEMKDNGAPTTFHIRWRD